LLVRWTSWQAERACFGLESSNIFHEKARRKQTGRAHEGNNPKKRERQTRGKKWHALKQITENVNHCTIQPHELKIACHKQGEKRNVQKQTNRYAKTVT
jgi:hypothetical protein